MKTKKKLNLSENEILNILKDPTKSTKDLIKKLNIEKSVFYDDRRKNDPIVKNAYKRYKRYLIKETYKLIKSRKFIKGGQIEIEKIAKKIGIPFTKIVKLIASNLKIKHKVQEIEFSLTKDVLTNLYQNAIKPTARTHDIKLYLENIDKYKLYNQDMIKENIVKTRKNIIKFYKIKD